MPTSTNARITVHVGEDATLNLKRGTGDGATYLDFMWGDGMEGVELFLYARAPLETLRDALTAYLEAGAEFNGLLTPPAPQAEASAVMSQDAPKPEELF